MQDFELTVQWQIILRRAPPILSNPFPVFINFLRYSDYSAKYAVMGCRRRHTCYTGVHTAVCKPTLLVTDILSMSKDSQQQQEQLKHSRSHDLILGFCDQSATDPNHLILRSHYSASGPSEQVSSDITGCFFLQ